MANIKSSKKDIRRSSKRRLENLARRSAIKTAIKKVNTALEVKAPQEQTEALLRDVAARLGRAKGKGVMHANSASRRLSRLAKRVSAQYRA